MGRTAARGEAYDPLAGFDDGQLWDVAPADFRRWCDAEGFHHASDSAVQQVNDSSSLPVSGQTADTNRRAMVAYFFFELA